MTRSSAWRATALAVAGLCLMPSVALAVDPFDPDTQAETLLSRERLESPRLEPAGDVNGDGHADVIAPDEDFDDVHEGRSAYVLFGPLPEGEPTFAEAVRDGFEIHDPPDFFNRRPEVEGIGDVNGDGRDDVLVGAPQGRAFVVFGSASTAPVDVEALGARGFELQGTADLAEQTTGLGDVNGDGRDDFALASGSSSVAVVFGKATTAPLDLNLLGLQGYTVTGISFPIRTVIGGGMDFNGDGRGDLVLHRHSGQAWVVYGKASTGTVDLAAPGTAAVPVKPPTGEYGTDAASEAGDVNGDGLGDVLLGYSKRAVVVYGRSSTAPIDAGALGTGGFALSRTGGYTSWVKPAGDADLDGYDDVVVTTSTAGLEQAHVVRGRPGTTAVNLAALGTRGYRVDRRTRVEGLGDVVADARPDLGGAAFALSPPRDATGGDCTIRGTASANTLNGTEGDDVICGLGGNDTINGRGGRDVIIGGDGSDRLNGGDGDDLIAGGLGTDTIRGDAGADRVSGGTGNDPLYGGTGDDFMSGGDGSDTLRGGDDADRLLGFEGTDKLYGEAGGDTLDGERGGDTADGGAGNDRVLGGGEADTLLGGTGDDVLRGEADSQSNAGDGRDTLRGGDGADDLGGDGGNDLLYGDAGDDTLDGSIGNDSLRGGLGNDRLFGAWGADTLNGEAGNDTLDSSADGVKDSNLCGAGLDAVTFDAGLDAVSSDCETRTGV